MEFTGLKNPSLKVLPLDIMYSGSLMDGEDLMVSIATPKFKQKQQRTDNKFVLSPITCSLAYLCPRMQNK